MNVVSRLSAVVGRASPIVFHLAVIELAAPPDDYDGPGLYSLYDLEYHFEVHTDVACRTCSGCFTELGEQVVAEV